jgi:DNA mismatch endonuclease, patch repair protein
MASIRGKNTKPELFVRRGLHSMGFRFKLHDRSLPGRPDMVLPKWRAVIFVHGCFWHGHDCSLFRWPATREAFWRDKIVGNRVRDVATERAIERAGWRILIIWECSLKGPSRLDAGVVLSLAADWLRSDSTKDEIREANGVGR